MLAGQVEIHNLGVIVRVSEPGLDRRSGHTGAISDGFKTGRARVG